MTNRFSRSTHSKYPPFQLSSLSPPPTPPLSPTPPFLLRTQPLLFSFPHLYTQHFDLIAAGNLVAHFYGIYIYLHISILINVYHTHTHVHIHTYTHVHIYTHIHRPQSSRPSGGPILWYMHISIYFYIYKNICTHKYMHSHFDRTRIYLHLTTSKQTHRYMYLYTHIHTCIHVHIWLHVYLSEYICVHAYMYLYQKPLGCRFSTPCPLFCLNCTIISNKTGHLD